MLYEYNRLGVETLIHEAVAGQMEISFTHGDPPELAGRMFLFKRVVRGTALRHGIFATFMAKPMETEPGSAIPIRRSIVDAFCAVKELEYGTYNRVISSWEREHLLLLV
jgi:glutamine synthetase